MGLHNKANNYLDWMTDFKQYNGFVWHKINIIIMYEIHWTWRYVNQLHRYELNDLKK